jgi:hypothetical protein
MDKADRPTAIQVEIGISLGTRFNNTTKKATKTGFAPIIGVMRLASPLRRERKQSIWDRKKRIPKRKPKKINSRESFFSARKG